MSNNQIEHDLAVILSDLSITLSQLSDKNKAFDKILSIICKIDEIDSGGLYLTDPITNELNLVAHLGLSKEFIKLTSHYSSDSLNVSIVNKGIPIYKTHNLPDNLKSTVIIPIKHNDKSIACLNLASHTHNSISENTKYILETIAFNLGGTILRLDTEESLRESKENFESLFNTIDDFLFILDDSGNILEINKSSKKLGYDKEDLIGKSVLSIHPPELRDEANKIVIEMLNGSSDFCSIPIYCKNGDYYPVETKVVKGTWNKKNAIFGISRDIIKRKKAEDSLQHTLKQQTLLSNIAQRLNFIENLEIDIKYVLNIIGEHINVSRVYIFENDDQLNMTSNTYEWCNIGISSEIMNLQKKSYDTFPSWIKLLKEKDMIFSSNIKELPIDVLHILEAQSIKSILVFPLKNQEKNIFGFIGFDECTTNRNWETDEIELLRIISNMISNTFERVKLQNELKIANSTKDKFFSIISHDLRGPIGNLMQMSEIIYDDYNSKIEISKDLIECQKINSKNTFYLLENLLNWSKINKKEIDFNPKIISINGIIKDNLEIFNYEINKKNISIYNNIKKEIKAYGDENMIHLIIRNLLSNAIKFTTKNGHININSKTEKSYINIKFSDNGKGIQKKNIEKILSDYNFYSTYGTEKEKGNGIGLKLCKNFIKINNGTFKIESELNKGSTFSFTLPLPIEKLK